MTPNQSLCLSNAANRAVFVAARPLSDGVRTDGGAVYLIGYHREHIALYAGTESLRTLSCAPVLGAPIFRGVFPPSRWEKVNAASLDAGAFPRGLSGIYPGVDQHEAERMDCLHHLSLS
jgi:hypothetical protein